MPKSIPIDLHSKCLDAISIKQEGEGTNNTPRNAPPPTMDVSMKDTSPSTILQAMGIKGLSKLISHMLE